MTKSKTFPVGLTDEQRATLQKAADEAGKSLAAWIRETCLLAAAGQLVPTASSLGEMSDRHVAAASDFVFRGTHEKPSKKGNRIGREVK